MLLCLPLQTPNCPSLNSHIYMLDCSVSEKTDRNLKGFWDLDEFSQVFGSICPDFSVDSPRFIGQDPRHQDRYEELKGRVLEVLDSSYGCWLMSTGNINGDYPLVNVYIFMENHHFWWVNQQFLWPLSIAMLVHRVNVLSTMGYQQW